MRTGRDPRAQSSTMSFEIKVIINFHCQPNDGYVIAETCSWLYLMNEGFVLIEYILLLIRRRYAYVCCILNMYVSRELKRVFC
jgi:hypothetical protein